METAQIFEKVGNAVGLGCFAWPISKKGRGFCSDQASRIFASDVNDPAALEALLDPADVERVSAALALESGFSLELRLRNGRWIELNVTVDTADGDRRWLGTVADTTHRVMQAERSAGENIYQAMAENSPAMLWMGDENGKCIFLNSALREFWGVDPEDLSTFDWTSTTHPDDVEKLSTPFLKAMADQEPFKVEARYRRADGCYRTMRTEARPRFDRTDGTFLGMSGVNVDITDRLEAEQQVAESTRLRDAIMQVSPDAIVTVDAEGHFIDFNPGAEAVFGRARAQVLGQEMDRLIVPAHLRARHRAGMKRYLATGEVKILGQRLEMSALKADGTEFPAEIAIVRIPGSEPAVFTAFIRDISARKAAEEHNRLLMGELNHRTKNILSVVQAVARQTARHTKAESFHRVFDARLLGLAASNDLLVKGDWSGVEIMDLLEAQLTHVLDDVGTRLLLSGPQVKIAAKAAQTLGMAIHELVTNSLKHGALGHPEGRVDLTWRTSARAEESPFEMKWIESGLRDVTAPTSKGFGHAVIVDMVAAAFDADVDVEFRACGFRWSLRARSAEALNK
ncbi:MAG: PAS domain S-box protein [Aquamicrobium sp.]|nr:PAS domain S-box protein [Aquamicrobium sp.]